MVSMLLPPEAVININKICFLKCELFLGHQLIPNESRSPDICMAAVTRVFRLGFILGFKLGFSLSFRILASKLQTPASRDFIPESYKFPLVSSGAGNICFQDKMPRFQIKCCYYELKTCKSFSSNCYYRGRTDHGSP